MGNLLKRLIAFILGMVFTLTAGVGAVVGGAYWAYKTVKPLHSVDGDSGLGDLRDQSIEDLIGLIQNALNEPDKYTFARLEAEYGIDLKQLLEKLGITDIDASGKNWNALMGISLFALKDGIEPLLDSIPLRAIYNFLPAETLDGILSPEAQEKLGNYTLLELIKSDDEGEDVGIIKALCTLKIGAFLPKFFTAVYDDETSSYTYVLNESDEAQALPILKVIANVSIGAIKNIATGGDIMKELVEGGLSPVADMPIEDIIGDLLTTISPELGQTAKTYLGALNGAKLSDLFKRNSEGGYEIYYTGVISDIKIGNLLGLVDIFGDGVWRYASDTSKLAPDLLQTVANLKLGSLFYNDGMLDMVNQLIGDVSFGMIFDAIGIEEGQLPAIDALRKIQIGKLLDGQTDSFDVEKFMSNLIENIKESLGDVTLKEFLGIDSTGNAFVDRLISFRLSDFVLSDYNAKSILAAFKRAFGDITIGDAIGFKRNSNGSWDFSGTSLENFSSLGSVLDLSIANVINLVSDVMDGRATASQIVKNLFPELCLGDFAALIPGVERDPVSGEYSVKGKDDKVVVIPANVGDVLDTRFYEIISGFEDGTPYDIFVHLENILIGDIVKPVADAFGFDSTDLVYDEESNTYTWKGEAGSATSKFFSLSITDIVKDGENGFEKFKNYLVHDFAEVTGELLKIVTRVAGIDDKVTDGDIDSLVATVKDVFTPESTMTNYSFVEEATIGTLVSPINVILRIISKFGVNIPEFVHVAVGEIDSLFGYIPLSKAGDLSAYDKVKLKAICSSIIKVIKSANDDYDFVDEAILDDIDDICAIIFGNHVLSDPHIDDFYVDEFSKAVHALLKDLGVNNADIDAGFEKFAEIYKGVRLSEFLKRTGDLKIGEVVKLAEEFIPNFEINELVYDSASDKYVWKNDPDCSMTAFFTNTVGNLFNDLVYNGAVDTLNTTMYDYITALGEVVKFVTDKAGIKDSVSDDAVDSSVELLTGLIIGTLGAPGFNENELVAKGSGTENGVSEKLLAVIKAFGFDYETNSYAKTAYEKVNELYGGVKIKDFVEESKKIKFGDAIDLFVAFADKQIADLTRDKAKGNYVWKGDGENGASKFLSKSIYDFVADLTNGAEELLNTRVYDAVDTLVALAEITFDIAGSRTDELDGQMEELAEKVKNLVEETSTIGNIAFKDDANVSSVTDIASWALDDVFDKEKKLHKVVRTLIEQIDNAFGAVRLNYFADDVAKVSINDVVTALFETVKAFDEEIKGLSTGEKLLGTIDGVKDLVNDHILEGTLSNIAIKNFVVSDLVTSVKNIVDPYLEGDDLEQVKSIIDTVFDEIARLYALNSTTKDKIVDDTLDLPLGEVITSVAAICSTLTSDEKAKSVINKAADLVKSIVGGTISDPSINETVTIDEVCDKSLALVEELPDDNDVTAKVKEALTVLFTEIKELYPAGTLVKDIVSASGDLNVVASVNALANVVKVFTDDEGDITVEKVVALAEKVIHPDATFVSFKTNDDANVGEIIDSTKEITDRLGLSEVEFLNRIYKLVKIAIGGNAEHKSTLGNIYFDLDGLMAEMTTEEKIVAGAVVAVVAVTMYFVANDTLVSLVKDILGEDENLGALIAEPMGYTKDGDVYKYNDEENELASAIFALKVSDLLTKGYDFAALYNDNLKAKLTMENIAGIGEAVNAKYDVEPYKAPVNALLEEIAKLLGDSTFETVGERAANIELDDLIQSVANVVIAYNNGEFESVAQKSANLLKSIFGGTVSVPEIEDFVISDVAIGVKEIIIEAGFDNPTVNKTLDEIARLYAIKNTKKSTFVDDSKALRLDDIAESLGEIVKTIEAIKDKQGAVDSAVELIQNLADGTVSDPALANFVVSEVVINVKEIIKEFGVESETLYKALDEIARLYRINDTTKDTFVDDSKNLEIAQIVISLGEITKTIEAIKDKGAAIDKSVTLINTLVGGTVTAPEFKDDAKIGDDDGLAMQVDGILIEFGVDYDVVNAAFEEIASLYKETTLKSFVDDSKVLKINSIITSVANVLKAAGFGDDANKAIEEIKLLINEQVIGGTVSDIEWKDFEVAEVLRHVQSILIIYNIGGDAVKTVFDELIELYEGATRDTFVEHSKNLNVIQTVKALANIVTAFAGSESDVSAITQNVVEIAEKVIHPDATFVSFKLNDDGNVGEIIDSTNALTDKLGLKDVAFVNRIYKLAKIAIGGNAEHTSTLGNIYFDFDGLMNEATSTEKIIGGAVVAIVGVTLYFVANDTLVSLVKNALGDNDNLGSLIAEPMGYTKDGDVYKYAGEENELASAIFALKVSDLVTKGYDFAALYNDNLKAKLTAENLSGIGAAINAKYDVEPYKAPVNALLDEIAKLLGDSTYETIGERAVNIKLDDLIQSLANVVIAYNNGEFEEKAQAIADLLIDVADGKIGDPALADFEISEVVLSTEDVIKSFGVESDTLYTALEEIARLYRAKNTTKSTFVDDSKELKIHDILDSVSAIVKTIDAVNEKATLVDKIVTLVKTVVDGTVTKPAFADDAKVGGDDGLIMQIKGFLEEFDVTNPTLIKALDELNGLYNTTTIKSFVDDSKELKIHDILDSVSAIVKTIDAVNEKATLVDKIVTLVKTVVDGTVTSANITDFKVSDVVIQVKEIVNELGVNDPTLNKAFEEVARLYQADENELVTFAMVSAHALKATTKSTFIEDSKNLKVAEIVKSVGEIVKTIKGVDQKTTLVDKLVELVNTVVSGTVTSIKFADDAKVGDDDGLVSQAKGLFEEFDVKQPTLITALEELAELYKTTTIKSFIDDSKALKINNVTESLGRIIKTLTDDKTDGIIDDVVALAGKVIADDATFVSFKVNNDANVGELIDDAEGITDKLGLENVAFVKRIYKLAKVAIGGNAEHESTIGKIYFDFDGLMNEATTTEKIIGGAVVAVVGVTMYFVANDTLVSLVKNALGDNDNLGSLIAEPMGYTKNGDVYTFANAENELASAIFVLKVSDLLTKGYDFKALYNDNLKAKLTIDNVAMIFAAVNEKYDVDPYKDPVSALLIEIAKHFEGTTFNAAGDRAAKIKLDDLIQSVANVVIAYNNGEFKDKAQAIADLLIDVADGTVGDPGLADFVVSEVVLSTEDVIKEFGVKSNTLYTALEEIARIYAINDTTKSTFVDDSKEIKIHDVIDSVSAIVKTIDAVNKKATLVDKIVTLVKTVVDGTVTKPAFADDAKVGGDDGLIMQIKGFLEEFDVTNPTLIKTLEELADLYKTTTIKSFVDDSKALKLNDITVSVGEIVKTVKGADEKEALIDKVVTLVNTLIGGTIDEPMFNDMAKVGDTDGLVMQVKGLLDEFGVKDPTLTKAFEEIADLYKTTTIKSFVDDSKALKLNDITVSVGEIVKTIKGADEKEALIDKVVTLVNTLVGGTIAEPMFNDMTKVGDTDGLVMQVKGLLDEFGVKDPTLTKAFEELADLYKTTTIKSFVDDSKALKLNDITVSVGEIVKTIKGADEKATLIDEIVELVNAIVEGTVSSAKITDFVVSDVILQVKAIVNELGVNDPTVDKAFEEVAGLYRAEESNVSTLSISVYALKATTRSTFVEDSKNLEIAKIVKSVGEIVKTIKGVDKKTTLVDKAETLINTLASGTVSKAKFNDLADVGGDDGLIMQAKGLLEEFGVKDQATLDKAFEELSKLYETTTISSFVDDSKAIKVNDVIAIAGEIVKTLTNDKIDGVIDDVVALAGKVITEESTFVSFKVNNDANVGELIDGAEGITDKLGLENVKAVKRIYKLAKVAIGGSAEHESTIGKIYFDFDGLMNEATTTEKIIGGAVVAVVGVTMYFVANDTLVKLVGDALGDSQTIGSLVAKPAGYEKDGDVYKFENAENELASAIFALKVTDLLTKGYDFKALYNDNLKAKLTVDNVAMIFAAVNAKYDVDPYKAPVRALLDETAKLLKGATVETVGEKASNIKLDDLTVSLGEIVKTIKGASEKATLIDKIVTLVNTVIDGTVTEPLFNDLAKVGGDDSIIAQVNDVLEKEFNVTDATVLKAIGEINGIYAGTTIKSFVSDSKLIKINDITASVGEIVKTVKGASEKATIIDKAVTLVNTVIGGTVSKPVYNDMAKVGGDDGLVMQVKGFVEEAKFNADVKAVVLKAFDETADLYETATINSFVKYTNSLAIASVTEAAGEIVKAVKGAGEKAELIDKSVALVNTLISGRVSKPLFNDLAKVGDDDGLIMQAKGIIGEFKLDAKVKAIIDKTLDEAAGIYETTTIKTFVNDSKNIEIDSLIEAVKQIVRTAVGEEKFDKSNAGKYFDILAIAVSGTVSKITFSLKDAWNDERLTQTDKLIIGAVGVGSGLFAYYALNDTLVSLVKKTYGEKTLGEVVGEALGYTQNAKGDWTVKGLVNELTNNLFKVKAYTFVNKSQYDIVKNVKQYLSIGNVISVAKQTLNGFNNALPEYEAADGTKTKLKLTQNAAGKWTLGLNELDAVITLILNAKYDDILDYAKADKEKKPETTIGKQIDALTVSDLGVGFAIAKLANSGLASKAGLDIKVSYNTTIGKWTYASKKGGKGTYATICDVIFNTQVKEVREALDGNGAKVLVKRWISSLTFGDILGDSLLAIGGSNYKDYLNGIGAEYVDGTWVASGRYKTLNGNILNLGIYDAAKALKTEDGIDGLLKLVLNDVYAGELFGRTISKNEETNEISWYDENGEKIDFTTMNRGALSEAISNVSLVEFMENNFDIGYIIDDMLVGEIMDYVCTYEESDSGEYVLDAETNKYVKATAETPADAQRYARVWTDHEGNVQNSSILLIMLNYTVEELCSSDLEESLKGKINDIKVSEMFGDYNEPSNKIFHTLTEEEYKNVTIGELSDVMYNSLQTASLQTLNAMGLFRDGMFDDGQPLGLLNNYSVVKEDGTEEIVGLAGINMGNLDKAVTQCINKANVGKLLDAGILPLSEENQAKLDVLFGKNVWKEKTVDALITDILDRIPASTNP